MRRGRYLALQLNGDFMTNPALLTFPSAAQFAPYRGTDASTELPPWRSILAVEPDVAVLDAKSLLLTHSNYRVTKATGESELFSLRDTKAAALAILSDHLGQRHLGSVAATVRRQWPRTRILILGEVPRMLDDYLYDEQIYRSTDPKRVIADLERLYEGMWNRRSDTLDWDATRPARSLSRPPRSESDPTKAFPPAPCYGQSLRDRPSGLGLQVARHH